MYKLGVSVLYIHGPETPKWFLPTIDKIINTPSHTPSSPPLKFELMMVAALHNMEVLRGCDDSIQELIQKNKKSFIGPGSEFRSVHLLETLFMHHHNWCKIYNSLSRGSIWPLLPLSDENRIAKNKEFITRGNHKSAIKYEDEFVKIVRSEISQGWMFPLPMNYINVLKHGELAPVGIDDKVWSELPDGSKKVKYRLTHDQSFEGSVGKSVNGRVREEDLAPLLYGGCFSRIIHYIVDVRLRHPNIPILGAKSDFKAAYRRVSLHGSIAEKCAIMCEGFALPSLRLTFGGSPCPPEFCIYSELPADLANDLLRCSDWDPNKLKSPHSDQLKKPLVLGPEIPFCQAKNLDVQLEPDDFGKVDIFIDDRMVVIPDLNANRNRAVQALLLSIHTLCRPLDPNEPIQRDDCLSLSKLVEEGQLSERFVLLGWQIDTRRMTIALPSKKSQRWDKDLGNIIFRKKISFGMLESMLGRLNHAASAYPIMRYFLSRIRALLTSWDVSNKSKKVERYLSTQVIEDFRLWKDDFLPVISKGLSLNLITYRRPSFLCWSDACPEGLGGFDHKGRAWRYQIPPEFRDSMKHRNNCLEFLAMMFTIWQAVLQDESCHEECFLSLGDNSSAVGWLHKASIDPSKNLPLFLASRKFAQIVLENNSCIYSQHIPGVSNSIADILSRRFDLNDDELTTYLNSVSSYQVQNSFRLFPVHQEINSWMIYWLQKCREMRASHKIPETKRAECGTGGSSTPDQLKFVMTSGCQNYIQNNVPMSLKRLPRPSEDESFLVQTRNAWLHQQFKRPWQNWVRS